MECWGECFFLGMFGHLCLEVEHHKCSTVVAIVNSQLETEPGKKCVIVKMFIETFVLFYS